MTIEELEQQHNFSDQTEKPAEKVIIKVIGVGGGGCNAVTHMYKKGIPHISYALANTDLQQLNRSPVPTRLLLGPQTTKGLGAGNIPEVAREAAEESVAEINKLFDDDTRMVFITAGMGGGTGTGASPVVARVARERGLLTIGIVTIPFLFEGEKKILKALNGRNEIAKYADAVLVINNEILTEEFGDLDLLNAFAIADNTLTNAASSIAELITSPGHMNVDFNDVYTTLNNGGFAIISTGYAEGEGRIRAAIQDALHSPLLRDRDIYSSSRILFNLYFNPNSENPVKMSEIKDFEKFTKEIRGLDVIYGVSFDENLGEKVKVSILAAGFKTDISKDSEVVSEEIKNINLAGQAGSDGNKTELTDDDIRRLSLAYGQTKIRELQKHRDAQNFVILTPEQMDDDMVLEMLESTPAFSRNQTQAEAIRNGNNEINIQSDSDFVPYAPVSPTPNKETSDSDNENSDDFGTIISFG